MHCVPKPHVTLGWCIFIPPYPWWAFFFPYILSTDRSDLISDGPVARYIFRAECACRHLHGSCSWRVYGFLRTLIPSPHPRQTHVSTSCLQTCAQPSVRGNWVCVLLLHASTSHITTSHYAFMVTMHFILAPPTHIVRQIRIIYKFKKKNLLPRCLCAFWWSDSKMEKQTKFCNFRCCLSCNKVTPNYAQTR